MVLADSTGIPPVPAYSGSPTHTRVFVYQALTVYGCLSQSIRLLSWVFDVGSYNPDHAVT